MERNYLIRETFFWMMMGVVLFILASAALAEEASTPVNLAETIRSRFEPLGGIELELPAREPMREPPELDQ